MGYLQGQKWTGRSGRSDLWILILNSQAAKRVELGDHLQRVYSRWGEVVDRWVVYLSLCAQPRWLRGDWVRALCTSQVLTVCMRSWRLREVTVDHLHDQSVLGQLLQALDLAKFDNRRERRCNR